MSSKSKVSGPETCSAIPINVKPSSVFMSVLDVSIFEQATNTFRALTLSIMASWLARYEKLKLNVEVLTRKLRFAH